MTKIAKMTNNDEAGDNAQWLKICLAGTSPCVWYLGLGKNKKTQGKK